MSKESSCGKSSASTFSSSSTCCSLLLDELGGVAGADLITGMGCGIGCAGAPENFGSSGRAAGLIAGCALISGTSSSFGRGGSAGCTVGLGVSVGIGGKFDGSLNSEGIGGMLVGFAGLFSEGSDERADIGLGSGGSTGCIIGLGVGGGGGWKPGLGGAANGGGMFGSFGSGCTFSSSLLTALIGGEGFGGVIGAGSFFRKPSMPTYTPLRYLLAFKTYIKVFIHQYTTKCVLIT